MTVNEIKALQKASLSINGVSLNKNELMEIVHFIRDREEFIKSTSVSFVNNGIYVTRGYQKNLEFGDKNYCDNVVFKNERELMKSLRNVPNTIYKKKSKFKDDSPNTNSLNALKYLARHQQQKQYRK